MAVLAAQCPRCSFISSIYTTPPPQFICFEQVPKGDIVWFSNRVVVFQREAHFEKFLASLSKEDRRSIFMWTWPSEDERGRPVLKLTLDEGSLVNHSPQPTTGPHPECDRLGQGLPVLGTLRLNCLENNYAVRDIEAGEELTDDYADYDDESIYADLPWVAKLEHKYGYQEDKYVDSLGGYALTKLSKGAGKTVKLSEKLN